MSDRLRLRLLLAATTLALPAGVVAVPANRSLAVETALVGQPGPASAAVTLAAGCWLEGEVEAVARLTVAAAPAPTGRAAAGGVSAEAGLRWAPDEGRWRPTLALALGVRRPGADLPTAATGLLQAGVERLVRPGWALGAAVGLRWVARQGASAEAALGVRAYF